MHTLDHSLAGSYRAAELRAEAQRDAVARAAAPSALRQLARRFTR